MLVSEAPDELTAAAFALTSILPEGAGLEEVLSRLGDCDPALRPCLWEALALAHHPRLSERLAPLLTSKDPELRVFAARLVGHRQDSEAGPLLPLLDDASPAVRTTVALALAELGHRPALAVLERKLSQAPLEELGAWALAALRLGSSRAPEVCRQASQSSGPVPPMLLQVLALAGQAQDFARVQRLCARPELSLAALEALGILGVPASVPLLIEHLGSAQEDPREAAASALALLTGAGLTMKVRLHDEEDDAPEAVREVTRPSTDATAWGRWWSAQRTRLDGVSRLRYGEPCTAGSHLEELTQPGSTLPQRARAAVELGIRSGHFVGFQPDWPIHRQRQALAQWRGWWEESARGQAR